MKTVAICALLLLLTYSHALERGKHYFRDKICHEFNTLGKEKFREVALVLNSRKYSNATFEEIKNIVNEIVTLAEKCCIEGADAECYDSESLALSAKSCDPNSPFPKHPETEACCTHEGLERKLCLAALKHPPKEFSTYVLPSPEEICEGFKNNPQDFIDKFLHEYSSEHSHTPLPLLLSSVTTFLSIAKGCCGQKQPALCFIKERLKGKPLQRFADLSNKACSRYDLFGKEKIKLSYLIRFTQKSSKASFEDILAIAEDATSVLSKCCDSLEADCIQREVSNYTTKICDKLSAQDQRIENCCKGCHTNLTVYMCIYMLPWEQPGPQSPDPAPLAHDALCGERGQRELEHYVYSMARIFTHAPEAILTTLYDTSEKIANTCCNTSDPTACFGEQIPEPTAELLALLSKGSELCVNYANRTMTEFQKWLKTNYHEMRPGATEDAISALVEQKATFASTCCHLNVPPSYCGLKVQQHVNTRAQKVQHERP
ncbi:vitamin D-binding protein [Elgaria multicarinata webbii]|uniref:vitamin D-binding protein n=1 Tax=Elgaria multicarinata webbii TaxID=159646 RepID=UPI002FCD393E